MNPIKKNPSAQKPGCCPIQFLLSRVNLLR